MTVAALLFGFLIIIRSLRTNGSNDLKDFFHNPRAASRGAVFFGQYL
jgi:hypothetical protein